MTLQVFPIPNFTDTRVDLLLCDPADTKPEDSTQKKAARQSRERRAEPRGIITMNNTLISWPV